MTWYSPALLIQVAPEELGIKYTGFEIPDKWVVGYGTAAATPPQRHRHSRVTHTASVCALWSGMDYDERYRCLPFIGVLKRSVYDSTFVVEAEATNSQ